MRKQCNNQSGFTVVGTLIAITILSIGVIATTTSLASLSRQHAHLSVQSELQEVQAGLYYLVSSPGMCQNSSLVQSRLRAGQVPGEIATLDILESKSSKSTVEFVRLGARNSVEITKISVRQDSPRVGVSNRIGASILVTIEDSRKNTHEVVMPLMAELDSASRFKNCYMRVSMAQICGDLGLRYDPEGEVQCK